MSSRLFARLMLAAGLILFAAVLRPGGGEKAEAQSVGVSLEFREALTPHGRWHRHSRWGEVWIPAKVDREWRPYTRGHWVYTEEWGWYWVASDEEEEWGWVAYHYGRWVYDRGEGWIWIPGEEWGPAWVSWRRGGEEVGWAPLPPEDYVDEIEDDPEVWIFVRERDVIAPSIVQVVLPRPRVTVLVRQTVIVNRTVFVSNARVAANAGVPPSYIAARVGRPLRVAQVRPVVLRGTAGVSGAVEVDVREQRGQRRRPEVREVERRIEPAKDVPPPRRFERGKTPDSPDAPKVLRQAQPQDRTPDAQKKDDAAPKQKTDDASPKAKQQKEDAAHKAKGPQKEDAPQTKQKRDDDAPKAKQQKQDDAAPKRKRDDDVSPKAKQQKQDDVAPRQERKDETPAPKRDAPKSDAPKSDTPKRDLDRSGDTPQRKGSEQGPRGDQQPKRDLQPKQDAAPKTAPQQAPSQAPQRQEAPKGPGPGRDKKDD